MVSYKILSIVIPSFNRLEKITNQVRAILPKLPTEVELVVIDNCSEYNIFTLFTEEEISRFTIIRNKFNVGADANIAKCFESCSTEWLWTLSDDDVISEDAIYTILNDIKNNPDAAFLNYHQRRSYTITTIDQYEQLGICDYWASFWMSACIYNVDQLKNYMDIYYRALSTMQPNVVMFCNLLVREKKIKLCGLKKELIVSRSRGNVSWNREEFIYASFHVFDILHQYSLRFNGTLFKQIAGLCYNTISVMREKGVERKHVLKLLFVVFYRRGIINTLLYDQRALASCVVKLIIN